MMTSKQIIVLTFLMLGASIIGSAQNVITIGSDFQTSTYRELEQIDISTLQFPMDNNTNTYEIEFVNTTTQSQNITLSIDNPIVKPLVISYFHPNKGWEIIASKGSQNVGNTLPKSTLSSNCNITLGITSYPQKFRISIGVDLHLNNAELRVSSSKYFTQKISTRMYLLGMFYGLLLIIIIYSLFSYFSLRNSYFFWFALFVFFIGLKVSIKTGIFTYFINVPNHQLIFEVSSIVSTLVFLSFIRFLQLLVNVKKEFPKLNQILIAIIVFRVLVNIIFIAFPELGLESLLIISRLGLLLALFIGFYVSVQYRKDQSWFTMAIIGAFSFFILTGLIGTFLDLQLLSFNFLSANVWSIACITQVLLFLIAITIKVNRLADERIALGEKMRDAKKALIQAYVTGVKTEKEHVYRDLKHLVLDEFESLKDGIKEESTKLELEKIEIDIRTISDELKLEAGQKNAFIKNVKSLITEHNSDQLKINFKSFDCNNHITEEAKST